MSIFELNKTADKTAITTYEEYLRKIFRLQRQFKSSTKGVVEKWWEINTGAFLGGMLRRLNISFEHYNDENFYDIATVGIETYNVISNDEFCYIFSTMSESNIIGLLKYLADEFADEFEKHRSSKMKTRIEIEAEYADWLMRSVDYERGVFVKIMEFIDANPNTPIELLIELM